MARDPIQARAYQQRWYRRNRKRVLRKTRIWQAKNARRVKARRRVWLRENRDKTRAQRLRFHYGITPNEYDALLKRQRGVCAVCHRPPDERFFCIDHDHKTGRVRGLLHRRCNLLVGQLERHRGSIRALLAYVKWRGLK